MGSLCLMLVSLGVGQTYDPGWMLVPSFIPGVELVYRGVCTEENLVPGVQHVRQYDLETILLMQKKDANFGTGVLQTSLTFKEPRDLAVKDTRAVPGSVRLDAVRIDRRGVLRRDSKSASSDEDDSLPVPLEGPPLQETGAFFEVPVVPVNRLSYWEELEDHRPMRGWCVLGIEKCAGAPCLKLQWTQESPDWKAPRADSTAWRRQDTIWFATQAGQVFGVERIIERRDPGRTEPTQRLLTKYELESRFMQNDRFYETRLDEIAKFSKFQDEANVYLAQPAQYRKHIEDLLGRITAYSDSTPVNTYRKSLVFLKSKLERARMGEVPVSIQTVQRRSPPSLSLGIGQKAPNFLAAEMTSRTATNMRRFYQYLGQPILVLYYDPTRVVSIDALQAARKLSEQHGDDLLVLGMAVSGDQKMVCRQHEELDLPFPVLDGKAMMRTFGVDGTPRIVLLNDEGVVRFACTGWGNHSEAELAREVQRLMVKKPRQ